GVGGVARNPSQAAPVGAAASAGGRPRTTFAHRRVPGARRCGRITPEGRPRTGRDSLGAGGRSPPAVGHGTVPTVSPIRVSPPIVSPAIGAVVVGAGGGVVSVPK